MLVQLVYLFLPATIFADTSVVLKSSSSPTSLPLPVSSPLDGGTALNTVPSSLERKRTKRQCGGFGCGGGGGGGCRGSGCNRGGGCRGAGCGGGGCRGGGCGRNFCANPCGVRLSMCCDDPAPRPCVGCGLNSGRAVFPAAVPVVAQNTCCACCMPTCVPRCVNFGGCGCNRFNRFDYDYYG